MIFLISSKKISYVTNVLDILFCFVCVEVLRPRQELRSCRAGQLPINTVPEQA